MSAERNAFRASLARIHEPPEEAGVGPVAFFHSHSRTLWPSPTDCRSMAETDIVWVIGVRSRDRAEPRLRLRGYQSRGGRVHIVPVED